MNQVRCKDCRHFRTTPYEAPHTGCWHPDNLVSRQSDAFLDQQQLPGNHVKLNLRGDCGKFEARARKPGLLQRLLSPRT